MSNWNRRIAVASVLVCLAAPALAADPAQDCTVCRDPMWPTLENLMPGIALDVPAAGLDASALQVNGAGLVAVTRAPGVGVAAVAVADARGSVYADPTWPQSTNAAAGIGVPGAVVAAPRAAPARVPATSPIAAR